MSDELVRIQMDKIKKSPYLYTDGLKETYLSVSQCLLFGEGMHLQELMNSIAYVFKKEPPAKPSLHDAVIGISASDLAETISCGRLDD